MRSFDFSGAGIPGQDPKSLLPLVSIEAAKAEGARILIFTGPSPHGSHVLGVFNRCPALYDALYVSGWLSSGMAATDYLTRGTLVHVGLAHHYARAGAKQRGGLDHEGAHYTDPEAFYTPQAAVALAAERMAAEGDRYAFLLLPLAQRILATYERLVTVTTIDRGIRVRAVEQVATITCGGFPFTARLDLVVDVQDGIMVWDHKVLVRPKEAANMYSHSGQIHGHRMIGNSLWGQKFKGSKLNAIPADPENGSIHRVSPHAAPGMVAAFPQMVYDTHAQIAQYKQTRAPGHWPRTLNCVDRYGVRCPAWDSCAGLKK